MNHTFQCAATILGFLAAAATAQAQNDGSFYRTIRVDENSSEYLTYRPEPHEVFRVRLVGDGDTDLDLFVRDDMGRLVCERIGPTDRETCMVHASAYPGRYRIVVNNLGNIFNVATVRVD